MAKFDEMEMPEAPMGEGEEEEMDLFEDEEGETPAGDLAAFSDSDLIDELKSRGFDIEEEGGEEAPEEPAEDAESEMPF